MLGIFKKSQQETSALTKEQLPPAEWLKWAAEECKFTPDNWKLELAPYQLVFVHDEMNTFMHKIARKVCDAVTQEGFCYFIQKYNDDGSETDNPVALTMQTTVKIVPWAETKGAPSAHVHGSVYAVPSFLIKYLDTAKENGVQFTRRRVSLRFDYQDRVSFKDRAQIANFARDYLGYSVTRAIITSPIIKTELAEAWMYVGKNDFWEDQINNLNFVPVPLVKNKRTKHIFYKYPYELQE